MPLVYVDHIDYTHVGFYYYVPGSPKRGAMPLDGVHVAVRVVDLVAEVQVMQFYVNNESRPVDAEYIFPLDEKAAVCGFEAELPHKLLIGEVREKQEARAEYNAAIARGETAALLEQDKPDVFKQKIGNIPPHSRVNIRITYVTDLKVEADGSIRFFLPTAVAPRYTLEHAPVTYIPFVRPWHCCIGRRVWYGDYEVWRYKPYYELPFYRYRWIPEPIVQRTKPCAFSLTVEIETASDIDRLECPTHDVKWEFPDPANKKQATASLWYDTAPLGKDFVLRVHQHAPHEPRVTVEVAPDGSAAAMLTLVPDFDIEPVPTELQFVIDCSGSMSGERISAAARALRVFLLSLPQSCHFNIIKFGSRHTTLFGSGPRAYTEETLADAMRLCDSLSANLGGTELLQPLETIFGRKVSNGKNRQVFILTDGQVSNTEQVIECCRQNAHNSRVFTVGIGNDVSRALVEGMARAADGTAEFIVGAELKGTSAALELKIINQLKIATMPAIAKVMVDWGVLGALAPPSYDAVLAAAAEGSATAGVSLTEAASVAAAAAAAPTAATGENSLATFAVSCGDTQLGEHVCVVGSLPELGQWDPSKALKLVTHEGAFPVWNGSASLPEGVTFEFKFIKKRDDGYVQFEALAANRTALAHGQEVTLECGTFGAARDTAVTVTAKRPVAPSGAPPPVASATPAAPPSHSVGSGPHHAGPLHAGPQHAGPGAAPVSRFFKTGPSSLLGNRGAASSPHGVGSGTASGSLYNAHQPGALAPAVGYGHDASQEQAHGRNEAVYQAPFLPPPIFSGTKFLFFAFFAPGHVPNNKVVVTAEAPDGPMTLEIPITKLTTVGRTVHVLAARTLIRDLEQGTSHLHYRFTSVPAAERSRTKGVWGFFKRSVGGTGQDKASAWSLEPVTPPVGVVKREIVELGVRYQLVSSETSFVAVERWLDGRRGDAAEPLPPPSQAVPDNVDDDEFNADGGGAAHGGRLGGRQFQQQQQPQSQLAAPKLAMRRSPSPNRSRDAYDGSVSVSNSSAFSPRSSSMAGPPPPGASYGAPPGPAPGGAPPARGAGFGMLTGGGGGGGGGRGGPMAPPPPSGAAAPMRPGAAPSLSFDYAEGASMSDSAALSPSSSSSSKSGGGLFSSLRKKSKSPSVSPRQSQSSSSSSMKMEREDRASSPRGEEKEKKEQKKKSLARVSSEDDEEAEEEQRTVSPAPASPARALSRGSLSDVLQQQKFGGNFALDSQFAGVLGKTLAALEAALAAPRLAPLDTADVKAVWATLLALAALEKHFDGQRGVWEMCAEKAIAWLVSQLKSKGVSDRKVARVKVDELIAVAKEAI